MAYKKIETGGIQWLDRLAGTDRWYWGMDYTGGDLYEAEELFRDGHPIRSNRLIFVSYAEGQVFEPVRAEAGQYLGKPVFWEDAVWCLLVDFSRREIRILRCSPDLETASIHVRLPLDAVKNCYNLMLAVSPLTLVRQGNEDRFQVVWPEQGDFPIEPSESFDSWKSDRLIFSKWYEDPDYREETVIRSYPGGEVLETLRGSWRKLPDGQNWLLG